MPSAAGDRRQHGPAGVRGEERKVGRRVYAWCHRRGRKDAAQAERWMMMRRRTLIQSLVLPYAASLRAVTRDRPRLFLTTTRVEELKRKVATSHREIWEIVKENADALLGKMPPA